MPSLLSQKDFRKVQTLSFCYSCRKKFRTVQERTRDHVPPDSIFNSSDRNFPLILPAHEKCNHSHSSHDEEIGQLVGFLHGKVLNIDKSRLKVGRTLYHDFTPAALAKLDLKSLIWRWVRAFHAALYQEYLPKNTKRAIHPPAPSARKVRGGLAYDPVLPQHRVFVRTIKKNRAAGRIDRIVCRNQQCVYECVWDQASNRAWLCCFALRIYNWSEIGDKRPHGKMGCVGHYMPRTGLPKDATRAITIEVPYFNLEPLDPFGH